MEKQRKSSVIQIWDNEMVELASKYCGAVLASGSQLRSAAI